jgi:thiol-disulfide isomerase/thioredoxin
MASLVVLVAVLAAATLAGGALRARSGRVRRVTTAYPAADDPVAGALAALGVEPGAPATLVQFSSAFCAPCRAARVVLADLAARADGVRHIEVDAESHLDEVRALDIRRTPTTLIVDASGRVVGRVGGVPRRAELMAALDAITAPAERVPRGGTA